MCVILILQKILKLSGKAAFLHSITHLKDCNYTNNINCFDEAKVLNISLSKTLKCGKYLTSVMLSKAKQR